MRMDLVHQYLRAIALVAVTLLLPFFSATAHAEEATERMAELLPGATVVIEDVVCGEFDPMVVGDACMVRIRAHDGTKFTLLASDDFLASYGHEGIEQLRGKTAVLEGARLERIADKDALDVLNDFTETTRPEPNYYWWDGAWRLVSRS